MTTVTRGQPASASSRRSERDHGPAVDRQHRLRVPLGQRPQPRPEPGRDHDRRWGHARSERSVTKPRKRAQRPSPRRITRRSVRSSAPGAGGRRCARARRAEARLGERRRKRAAVGAQLA